MAAQQKSLILLIQDQGVQLLLWQQRKLTILEDFQNTPEDHEAFKSVIVQYPEHRVLVVTDLIDENFRHDHIVHVGGADRDALIKRKLDFSFRNARYRIGRVKGREKDGRKQDKLLLAAISKSEILDIWVNDLLEAKRAIQSITSTAWLLRSYLPAKKLDKEPLLLIVGVDPGASLRQSFFQDGKLLFSRLSNLNARSGPELAAEINNETLQVRQYLERIQFVQYEASMRIQVFSTLADSQLPLQNHGSETNRFESVDISKDMGKVEVATNGRPYKPVHYVLAQVLGSASPPNIYGPPSVTRYHDLLQLGKLVGIAAGLLLIAGIGGNLPTAFAIKKQWDQSADFVDRTQPLLNTYEQLSARFPKSELLPSEMAVIVEAHSRIKNQSFSPINAINQVGTALTKTNGVKLTSIQWGLEPVPFVAGKDETGRDKKLPLPSAGAGSSTQFANDVLRQNTQIKMIVNGESYSASSFREAQDQVLKLASALNEIPGAKVFATQLPTNVRPDVAVTITVDDREVRSPFTLEVTIAVAPLAKPDARVAVQP
jgi:hypothetical protein